MKLPDDPVDKNKFDAVLSRLIKAKPMSGADIKAIPKLKKDGTPKKQRKIVQKTDK
jgi:hypothetical protein